MAISANMTDNLTATGNWQLICGAGVVHLICDVPFQWGMSPADDTSPNAGVPHPANNPYRSNAQMGEFVAGQFFWLKAQVGAQFTITATAPTVA